MNFKLIESTINTPSPTDANGSSTFQHNKLRKNKHLADIQLLKKSKKYVVIAIINFELVENWMFIQLTVSIIILKKRNVVHLKVLIN